MRSLVSVAALMGGLGLVMLLPASAFAQDEVNGQLVAMVDETAHAPSPVTTRETRSVAPAPPPRPARTGTPAVRSGVELRGITISGGRVGRTVIESAITRRLPAIGRCHELALAENPTVRGTLTIRLQIAADGTVRSATVRSSVRSTALESCVRQTARTWSVPMPIGRPAQVTATVDLIPRLRW